VSAKAALTTTQDGTVTVLRIMLDQQALRSNEFSWGNPPPRQEFQELAAAFDHGHSHAQIRPTLIAKKLQQFLWKLLLKPFLTRNKTCLKTTCSNICENICGNLP
jgi:hypothetical protein